MISSLYLSSTNVGHVACNCTIQNHMKYSNLVLQWYMVSVVFVYNRWSKSEIRCYVDGQLASGTDMSWLVSSSDVSTQWPGPSFTKVLNLKLSLNLKY